MSTWALVFCVEISWVWDKCFGHNINLKWIEYLVKKLFEHGLDSKSSLWIALKSKRFELKMLDWSQINPYQIEKELNWIKKFSLILKSIWHLWHEQFRNETNLKENLQD